MLENAVAVLSGLLQIEKALLKCISKGIHLAKWPGTYVGGVPCRVERDVTQVTTSSRFLHILGLEINDKRKTGGHTSTSTAHMFLLPSFLRSRRVCEVWWWLSAATSSALIGAVSQCDQDDMMHVTLVAATKYPRNINLKLHQKVLKYHN